MRAAVRNVVGHALDRLGEAIVAARWPPGAGIAPEPALCANRASRVMIDGAAQDIEQVPASRRWRPSVTEPAARLEGRARCVLLRFASVHDLQHAEEMSCEC